jgi:hypothetical protein
MEIHLEVSDIITAVFVVQRKTVVTTMKYYIFKPCDIILVVLYKKIEIKIYS